MVLVIFSLPSQRAAWPIRRLDAHPGRKVAVGLDPFDQGLRTVVVGLLIGRILQAVNLRCELRGSRATEWIAFPRHYLPKAT